MSLEGLWNTMLRHLAPSVGRTRAGSTIPPVSPSSSHGSSTPVNSTVDESTTLTRSIRFGSVEFTPYSPCSRPIFSTLDKGLDLAFGDFRFHATREGMLRFPSPARSASTTASNIGSDSDSSQSSISKEDEDYHSIESEEAIFYDTILDNREPTVIAQVYMAGSTTSSAERRTINVTREEWNRAKDAVERSIVLPPQATQRELMAYHYLLSQKSNNMARLAREMEEERRRLDERKRLADLSSQRRAQFSAINSSTGRTPQRRKSRLDGIPEADRAHMTRNLESSFMTFDTSGNVIPKTPAAAALAVATYL